MRILAIDYGSKRVGIALSDEMRMLATPQPFITAEPENLLMQGIQKIVQSQNVSEIVIGFPKNMDGTLGESAQRVKVFAEKLEKITSMKVKRLDERLTTVQASRQLREAGHKAKDQREKIDSASAAILLQGYLDAMSF